jgi:hypothetical protein
MRLIGVLVSCLRVLLRARRVLLPLGVVALAVMVGCGTMRLGSVLMVLGGFVVFVSCHRALLGLPCPQRQFGLG